MSTNTNTNTNTLSQEDAVWLLSILDDEDWNEGPVSWETATRVASGNPA